jgi:hypothetical protein
MSKTVFSKDRFNSPQIDIFSDKSSLVLFWLLSHREFLSFSVNELARSSSVSVGLAHKVVKQLEFKGIISSEGLRTNKRFSLAKSDELLINWINHYQISNKTQMRGFQAASLSESFIGKYGLVPAVHTAATKIYHVRVTNLSTQEFYVIDWDKLGKVGEEFELTEMNRGYQILLIKPYYKTLIATMKRGAVNEDVLNAFEILTFLDLYHFPVRGIEQAEALYRNSSLLKSICSWRKLENAAG